MIAYCRPVVQPALNITIENRIFFTPGIPGSGAVLSLILNILQGKSIDVCFLNQVVKALQ